MEDLKKLESLSYVPANCVGTDEDGANEPTEKCQCGCCNPLASAPLEVKDKINPVIEPETRAIKQEVVGKHLEQPDCNTCGDTKRSYYIQDTMDGEEKVGVPCPDCEPINTGCAVKSPNLLWVEMIERYMGLTNLCLEQLSPNDLTVYSEEIGQKRLKIAQATEEIDLFQRTTLPELRKAFE